MSDSSRLSTLIVVAAGSSRRMGGDVAKQFLELDGRSILLRTLDAFRNIEWITERIVVLPKDTVSSLANDQRPNKELVDLKQHESTHPLAEKLRETGVDLLCAGGKRRQDSVLHGLNASRSGNPFVLIHDGARPFVRRELLERLLEEVTKSGAAVPGIEVNDTIKVVDDKMQIAQTLERARLRRIQTPQAFRYDQLLAASKRYATCDVTDDASIYELASHSVKVVQGDNENIKITSPSDLDLARSLLETWETQDE